MKKSIFFSVAATVLLIAGLFCSCGKGSQEPVVIIDVSNPKEAILDDIAENIFILPITNVSAPDIGNVSYAKQGSNLLFLYDDGLRQIHSIFDDGTLISTLNSVGRAANEYIDIGAFTFRFKGSCIDVFERETKKIKSFKLEDSEFQGEHELGFYCNAMECIGDNTFLFLREKSEGFSPAAILYDMDTDSVIDSLVLREDQVDNTMDYAISRMTVGKEIFLSVVGYDNIIYKVDMQGFVPVFSFRMTPNKLDKVYWEGDYNEEKEDYALSLRESGQIATCPVFYSQSKNSRSFYYLPGKQSYLHNIALLNLCVIRNGQPEVYSNIFLKGINEPIQPVGIMDGKYVVFIETEKVEFSDDLGASAKKIKKLKDDGVDYLLLQYSF